MNNKHFNILWITTDQQRWDSINAYGNKYASTPNLDKLFYSGVAFSNAYCQCPICTPSRASFLTGRYPSAINANINGASNLPEHCNLISKRLSDAGYDCGLIGKLHITSAWDDNEPRMDDGFSYFDYNLGPGHDLTGQSSKYAKWLRDKGIDWNDIFTNDGKHSYFWYKDDAPIELRQTAWCAEKATEYIKEKSKKPDKPWMLCVNSYDPHPPFDAPKEYVEKYLSNGVPKPIFSEKDKKECELLKNFFFQSQCKEPDEKTLRQVASYYAMCEISDMHMGRILDALDELGIRDNTIVIYNSDHGESLGDHGFTHKGCRFFEGLVHVPLIISCPSLFIKNRIIDDIVELTDIVPTIGELCNIDVEDASGISLFPVLKDGRKHKREFARTEYYNVLDESVEFGSSNEDLVDNIQTGNKSYAEMFRKGKYKICIYHGIEHGELYDLEKDPIEEENLWDNPKYLSLKQKLILEAFSASVKLSKPGQERRGRY